MAVVEQRRSGGEAVLTHQFLGESMAGRIQVVAVALGRDESDPSVVGHVQLFPWS